MDSIDDLRSELQRAGEILLDSLRPEFQELRKAIVNDIALELRHSRRRKIPRRTDPRKQAIARLIQENPKITNLQICRELDKLQAQFAHYAPLPSWNCQSWWETYRRVPNRLHAYINSVRHSLL